MELGALCKRSILLSEFVQSLGVCHGDKMCRLGQPIINHPHGVILPLVFSRPNHKICRNKVPFPLLASKGCKSLTGCWCYAFNHWHIKHLSTYQALKHIIRYFLAHITTPKGLLKVLVYFIPTRMQRMWSIVTVI